MELMPELPIEDIKANQGLEKNSLDKRYFVCDKLLAIFASKKVNENNTKNIVINKKFLSGGGWGPPLKEEEETDEKKQSGGKWGVPIHDIVSSR